MKHLRLGRRKVVALIDDEDWVKASKHNWYLMPSGYVYSKTAGFLQNFILYCPVGFQNDHIDNDKLNNQKVNLRVVTRSQNNARKGPSSKSSTRFKGVCPRWDSGRWHYLAQVCKDGKLYSNGTYNTPLEAAQAYNKLAKELHGDFAFQNPI